jgi:hypothetical protein
VARSTVVARTPATAARSLLATYKATTWGCRQRRNDDDSSFSIQLQHALNDA